MSDLLKHALEYNERGLAVVPIGNGSKAPIVKNWQEKKLTPEELGYHFTNGRNITGIGVITGRLSDNLAVLDFDGTNWRAGYEEFMHAWDNEFCYAPIVGTGSHKRHAWAKCPDMPENYTVKKFGREITGFDTEGNPIFAQVIEWRGNKCNNLVPPSLHPSGHKYEWLTSEAELPEVSHQEIIDWLAGWGVPVNQFAKLPKRTLEFLAAKNWAEGTRNREVYAAAQQFQAAKYPIEYAFQFLKPVALKIGLDEKEIEPTIKSGYNGAARADFEPVGTQNARPNPPTHDELADRWMAQNPLTAYGLGDWRRYAGGFWPVAPELAIKREIKSVLTDAKPEGVKPTAYVVKSVSELAKYEIAIDDTEWDACPDYLVCANGALHIPTRTLESHQPELYATSGVNYDYDPDATAPSWTAFLMDLVKNTSQQIVDFLQEFAGYSLTIDTQHEIAVWLYGPPGSGKSTFLTGLEAMLDSRAGVLGLADIERNRFALAELPGKTLAIATEQPSDFIASTHVLNALISGETLTIDRKFRDAITFMPRCKIAWAMNELPRVSDPNSGLFRRVKVVKFPAIPESEREPALKEEIKNEGAGILNWALDGLARLRERGRFDVPKDVIDATEDFRQYNDIPAQFVAECCVTGASSEGEPYRVKSSQLYNAYKQWCVETGHKYQSSTSVAKDWERLGFYKQRKNDGVYWFKIGLSV